MTKLLPGLIMIGLLGLLILEWKDWPPAPSQMGLVEGPAEVPSTPSDSTQDPLAKLEDPEDKDSYAAITERPIFRPDRRPEPPSDEQAAAEPEVDSDTALEVMDLSAILITPQVVSAWVKDPSQPKLRRLRIGDDFEGWSVREILEDRVLLERHGEQDTLILRDFSEAPPAAAPQPVPRRPRLLRKPKRPAVPRE